MFLFPIGDAPNPRNFRPWVTWGLIALNVAVYLFITLPASMMTPDPRDPAFLAYARWLLQQANAPIPPRQILAQVSLWDVLVFTHGYRSAHPSLGTLFTAMFMHANLAHVGGNMLFLWIYGDNVEHRLGRLRYLLTYLGTGAVATLVYALVTGPSDTPLVGASGAISGLLGFYFLAFPRNRVKLFVFLFPFVMDVILVNARFVLGAFVLFDNLLPFLASRGSGGGVAYGAHLGGFLAGLAVAWWAARHHRWRPRDTHRADRARYALDRAKRYLAAGQPVAAYHHLLEVIEAAPRSAEAREARALLARILAEAPRA